VPSQDACFVKGEGAFLRLFSLRLNCSYRPVQKGIQEWTAKISIRSLSSTPSASQPSLLAPHLCYACHTTLNSRGTRAAGRKAVVDVVPRMPVWAGQGLGGEGDEAWRGKVGEEDMKSQIAGFLIHDER
jgi:cytoplasmic tRNA 2-thiolation protein 2